MSKRTSMTRADFERMAKANKKSKLPKWLREVLSTSWTIIFYLTAAVGGGIVLFTLWNAIDSLGPLLYTIAALMAPITLIAILVQLMKIARILEENDND